MKTFFTLLPELKNVHLIKDVGMIPFTMQKYYEYDSYIITYKNDEYHYLKYIVNGLKLKYLNKKFPFQFLDIFYFLIRNYRQIDVFVLFHFTLNNILYLIFLKLLKKNTVVYVKLDADNEAISRITGTKNGLRYKFQKCISKIVLKYFVDIMSVETQRNFKILKEFDQIYSEKLFYLPNGIEPVNLDIESIPKKNQILTVGRLGTNQKATEILLNAFAKVKHDHSWELILVGYVDTKFEPFINNYFKENPNLSEKVKFIGNISNRNSIYKYYAESKIYCSTSRWEGFSLSIIEAAYFGDYLISTDVGGIEDILDVTKHGEKIRIDDEDQLAQVLEKLIKNWSEFEKDSKYIEFEILRHFRWKNLCNEIDIRIKKI